MECEKKKEVIDDVFIFSWKIRRMKFFRFEEDRFEVGKLLSVFCGYDDFEMSILFYSRDVLSMLSR